MGSVLLILYVLTGEVPERFDFSYSTFEECTKQLDIKSQELANEYEATVVGMCINSNDTP